MTTRPTLTLHAHTYATGGASLTSADGVGALAVKAQLCDREIKSVKDPAAWLEAQVRAYRQANPNHDVQVVRFTNGRKEVQA